MTATNENVNHDPPTPIADPINWRWIELLRDHGCPEDRLLMLAALLVKYDEHPAPNDNIFTCPHCTSEIERVKRLGWCWNTLQVLLHKLEAEQRMLEAGTHPTRTYGPLVDDGDLQLESQS